MARRTLLAVVLLIALAGAGCGTLENVKRPCFPPPDAPTTPVCKFYGGLRNDWDIITHYPWSSTETWLDYVTIPPLAAIDLFFTLVGDTFTLPYTGYEEIRRVYYGPSGPPAKPPAIVSEGFVMSGAAPPAKPQAADVVADPQAAGEPSSAPKGRPTIAQGGAQPKASGTLGPQAK